MFFLSHCCQSPFPHWESQLTSPPYDAFNTVLISVPVVGAAQILIWSYSVFCLQCPQLSERVHLLLWELSMPFYTFHRHRVCLDDCMDLICSLFNWWKGFGSSSLATLPLGFNCGFISTSARGLSIGVWSWGCPGELGFALWGPGLEVVQLIGSQGMWQRQVLRGVGG